MTDTTATRCPQCGQQMRGIDWIDRLIAERDAALVALLQERERTATYYAEGCHLRMQVGYLAARISELTGEDCPSIWEAAATATKNTVLEQTGALPSPVDLTEARGMVEDAVKLPEKVKLSCSCYLPPSYDGCTCGNYDDAWNHGHDVGWNAAIDAARKI